MKRQQIKMNKDMPKKKIDAIAFLTLSTLGKTFSRRHFNIFFFFPQKICLDISFPFEKICSKYPKTVFWDKQEKYNQFVFG